MILWIIF